MSTIKFIRELIVLTDKHELVPIAVFLPRQEFEALHKDLNRRGLPITHKDCLICDGITVRLGAGDISVDLIAKPTIIYGVLVDEEGNARLETRNRIPGFTPGEGWYANKKDAWNFYAHELRMKLTEVNKAIRECSWEPNTTQK